MSSSPEPERNPARREANTGGQAPSRPRSESRQRTALVAVRLLPEERDVLAKTARLRGITLSEFIRASAMRSASMPAAEAEALLSPGTTEPASRVPRSSVRRSPWSWCAGSRRLV
jgi:predicted HTH domain antitoxin